MSLVLQRAFCEDSKIVKLGIDIVVVQKDEQCSRRTVNCNKPFGFANKLSMLKWLVFSMPFENTDTNIEQNMSK